MQSLANLERLGGGGSNLEGYVASYGIPRTPTGGYATGNRYSGVKKGDAIILSGRSGDWSGVASSDAHRVVNETYGDGSNYTVLQIWIADHDGQIDITVGNRYFISAHPDYVTQTYY